jgi:DNA polymerase alpha subunit B
LFPRGYGDCIDSSRAVDIQLTFKPDILILPSQFKHFAKNIDGTIVVNPGHLCKNLSGGTYSKLTLYPTLNEEEQVRVDLYKL